jgi:hypothetical protein
MAGNEAESSGRDAQFLLDVGHHRVRQACLAEFREVLNDDVLPGVARAPFGPSGIAQFA